MKWTTLRGRKVLFTALAVLFVSTASARSADGDAAFMRSAALMVEAVEREDGFSGVILVARGDHILLRKAAGFADRERNVLNTPETKFPLASVNKQFTAAAILLLAEEGRLSLSDSVSKYYASSPPAWKNVTIQHLLTHSAGVRDNWANRPELEANGKLLSGLSYDYLIEIAAADPLSFEPGSSFRYSNTAYVLLTAVIERVSGQHYEEFLRTRILAPMGLRSTGYGDLPDDTLKGYRRSVTSASPQGVWEKGEPINLSALGGASGLYSTVDDLLAWRHSLVEGGILSTESLHAMFFDYGHNYGFAWYLQNRFGQKLIGHPGNLTAAGFASIFDFFPEEQLTVIALTNNTGQINYRATQRIDGREVAYPPTAARKVVEQVERLYFDRAP